MWVFFYLHNDLVTLNKKNQIRLLSLKSDTKMSYKDFVRDSSCINYHIKDKAFLEKKQFLKG